eukprot:3872289-Prymnesium_polylepis.1
MAPTAYQTSPASALLTGMLEGSKLTRQYQYLKVLYAIEVDAAGKVKPTAAAAAFTTGVPPPPPPPPPLPDDELDVRAEALQLHGGGELEEEGETETTLELLANATA